LEALVRLLVANGSPTQARDPRFVPVKPPRA
jgi:hypothetical protein